VSGHYDYVSLDGGESSSPKHWATVTPGGTPRGVPDGVPEHLQKLYDTTRGKVSEMLDQGILSLRTLPSPLPLC
jgi:hypothetical protein